MIDKGDLVPLNDGTLSGLEAVCERIDFRRGEHLFAIGNAADHALVLLSGRVAVTGAALARQPETDLVDTEGRLFGWEPLLFRRAMRLSTATAESDGSALMIDAGALGENGLSAEGRLSLRYLKRAAYQAFRASRDRVDARDGNGAWQYALEMLLATLLHGSALEPDRWFATATALIGDAATANGVVLYAVGDAGETAVVEGAWTRDEHPLSCGQRPLSAAETPWLWSRLVSDASVLEISSQDLPADAASETVWLAPEGGTSLLFPLSDTGRLSGVLRLDFDSADRLPDLTDRHELMVLARLVGHDVARRRDQDRIGKLAHEDGLTGLTNGLLFQDRLHLALARARRANRNVALLYLDLDQFTPMNQEFGTDTGDRLLQEIARRLKQCARESDTVGRVGDDEFAIMLEDIDGTEAALQAAQRVMTALNQPIHFEDQSFYVGVSVGIAVYPEHGVDAEHLIRAGAEAMSKAKRLTGSSYAFFSPDKGDKTGYRMQVEAELRAALAARDLIAYYQPIVDIRTGRIQGAEGLARWPREDGTVLGPSYFLPIAESTGMVIPMSRQILRQVCRETITWNKKFHTQLMAAVNVSTRWLVDQAFLDTVENTLRDTGLPAHCLTLELTEEILSRDLEASERALAGLKALGVKLALDDFGTGQSSLAFLERFTIDCIKVDRSFTSAIVSLDDDAPILRGTLALARELGASAVAEGVETEVQAGFLRRHGGTMCQGYFFGKPMPSEAFERRLTEQFGVRASPRAQDGRKRG